MTRKGKLISKIFGITLVFMMSGAMVGGLLATVLPLADLGKTQVSFQEDVSYMITHVLDCEGSEITSTGGMDPYCVEIYDEDSLI